MLRQEVEQMAKKYLEVFYHKYADEEFSKQFTDFDDFINTKFDEFMKQIYQCAILNNFFWGVWAISLLKPDGYTDSGMNYAFAQARIDMYYVIKKIIE